MPLHQPIEGGHGQAEMSGEIRPGSMGLLLKAADSGEHGKDRLKDHPLAPCFTGTPFQIGRVAGFCMKAVVAEDDPRLLDASDQRMKDRIMDLGRIPIPIDDPARLIDYNAELAPDDPAVIGQSFLTDLTEGVPRPPLTHRMEQLDAIAINNPERRRLRPEAVGPIGMGGEQAKQAGARYQAREQGLNPVPASRKTLVYSLSAYNTPKLRPHWGIKTLADVWARQSLWLSMR